MKKEIVELARAYERAQYGEEYSAWDMENNWDYRESYIKPMQKALIRSNYTLIKNSILNEVHDQISTLQNLIEMVKIALEDDDPDEALLLIKSTLIEENK